MSAGRGAARRFFRDKKAMAGLCIVLLEIAVVLLVPLLLPWGPNETDAAAGFWAAPSAVHWLGTDDVGRDIFARLLAGGRVSLFVGIASAGISILVGAPLGIAAGYYRGSWEFVIMRLADVFQCFPSIVVILCLVSLVGPSVFHIVWVIGIMGWPVIARLTYGETLAIRKKPYLDAAKLNGASDRQILMGEVLPNASAPIWAALAFRVSRAILSESSLSFLGVGIRTPQASWGNLIQYANQIAVLTMRPWVWLPAGLCILLTVLSVNQVGEGLQRAFNPKGKGGDG